MILEVTGFSAIFIVDSSYCFRCAVTFDCPLSFFLFSTGFSGELDVLLELLLLTELCKDDT